ncbi:hypothetical protein JXO59_00720 [candidate division KSB1 bacterium]|nr:hypothetical protein [candidate division KSB1 bacterium]
MFFRHDNDPQQYGVTISPVGKKDQPFPLCCPLLIDDRCHIHQHPDRPLICRDYQCQLLKKYMRDEVSLEFALRAVAEITRLFHLVKDFFPLNDAKPAFFLLQDAWYERKKEKSQLGRFAPNQTIDISSLIRLVNKYILPFEGGFLSPLVTKL